MMKMRMSEQEATMMTIPARSLRAYLVFAGALVMTFGSAAQTNVVPIAFGSVIAGQAPGGTTAACTTTLPTAAGIPVPGDGCPGTQATLNGPYGANVDSYGNVFFGDYNVFALRVLYMGGSAMSAAIQAANPTQTFTPQVGYVYTLAGSRSATISSSGTPKAYYCNGAGSGTVALGSNGDGCPATYGYMKPRSPIVDSEGNVLFTSSSGSAPVRVVYVGGPKMAALIALLNGGAVATPGYVYSIVKSSANGYAGDGALATDPSVHTYSVRDVALDSGGNIYLSDGTNSFTAPTYAANNDIRRIDATTGIISTYAGSPSTGTNACTPGSTVGCAGVYSGDGGPATAATFNTPYTIFFDKYDNLYITDYNEGRLRVVYRAGTVPGLSNLTAGNVYTVAGGGGTSAVAASSNMPATSLSFGTLYTGGIDAGGNIYIIDGTSKLMWRIDPSTGNAIYVGGGRTTTTAGVACATGSNLMTTDKIADGCPATQESIVPSGKLAFDRFGNFYEVENSNAVVRRFSFNTLLPTTAAGANVTQPLAFQTVTAQTITGESFTLQGKATAEFSDGGSASCTLSSALAAGTTCVFNVKFAPAVAGLRSGSISLSSATGILISEDLGGTGVAANISVDPSSNSILGSGYTPNGVVADGNGNLYFADSSSGKVFTVASSGGTPTALVTGLSSPAQIAVDGAGSLFVADTANNRIARTGPTGGAITALGTGLSAPKGVAVDQLGDVFVADTGNNRIVEISPLGGQLTLPITGLSTPAALTVDATGNLYIADVGNKRVLKASVSSEAVAINLGTSAVIPSGIAVDAAGDLYVADAMSGQVLLYAPGVTNAEALVTGLTGPRGLAIDANGSIYVADASVTGILAANRHNPTTSFPATNLNTSNTSSIYLSSNGNATLSFTGTSFAAATGSTAAFTLTPASTSGCALTSSLVAGTQCALVATFTPTAKTSYSETATFTTNAANTGQALLTGTGVQLVATTTALSITQPTTSTINYSQAVTVQAQVTAASNAGAAPTGTVTFSVDGKKQTPQQLGSTGLLTITLNPAVGTHAITVSYTGDSLYASSSGSLSFTVLQAATTTTLAIAPNSSSVVFTATVASTTATGETGTVTFYAGSTAIGTGTVGANGKATFTATTTNFASYAFSASYGGDTNFAASVSSTSTPGGIFYVQQSSATLSIAQGGVATLPITLTPLFGYTGTITASCSGLPQNSVCRFNPTSVTFTTPATGSSPSPQTLTLYVYTNVSSSLAAFEFGGALLAVTLLLWRKKKTGVALAGLIIACSMAAGGCSSSSSSTPSYVTPQGNSIVTVTLKDTSGSTQSFNFSFTVLPPVQLP